MEDVLEVYARLYDTEYPVICMDESSIQLIGEVHEPSPAEHGAIRDNRQIPVKWRFMAKDARIKLKRLHPNI
ncbi:hypothetical protein JWG39_10665 [Desulforhopalus vacuolatus]|uniref:hypothetical protein n=1 Tax=Desulforhopalus vacuolatus TaxID=40414 RepID=UPI001964F6A5|nr:hypothetical protein [Desulforhopalus vacuolatus]MBM9520276.1 hypothetical protein [Desulforhopalus vacuolatus]